MTIFARPSSDEAVAALLKKYECPTSFFAARTMLMGTIAAPSANLSPLAAIKRFWQGQMPTFASGDDAQALFDVLINGFWNRLADHQSSRHPFQLHRASVAITRSELGAQALMRKQEIAGFVSGLFGSEERLHLPEKADQALRSLAEIHSMFSASADLLVDSTKPAAESSLLECARNAHNMTVIAEAAINKVVQACKRAREHDAEPMASTSIDRHAFDWDDDGPPFVESSLSQQITRNGVTVQVEIYGDGAGKWILEVVDQQNNSHVWDEVFETDDLALDEAIRALEEEPFEFVSDPAGPLEIH